MSERKRTYESKAQASVVQHLAPSNNPPRPVADPDLDRQDSPNRVEKIDLLTRLIEHLKTL